MQVKFRIETLGYIVAEFLSDTKRLKIGHSSNYGDKFQELLNKFFFIYEIVKENNSIYFPYSTDVLWQDDFINYKWNISMNSLDSCINIKIDELSPSNSEYKEELLNANIKKEALFDDIYLSLDEALMDFGLVGYKKKWKIGNFPMYEYIILKSARKEVDLFNISCIEEAEWRQKIDFSDELGILSMR